MTTQEFAQAIAEAYQAYCTLYNDSTATREAQEAAFQIYQQLREDSEFHQIAKFEKTCEAEYWRAQALIAEMRAEMQEVPVYAERYRS